jgi:long-chain acyl-CoA synthetase
MAGSGQTLTYSELDRWSNRLAHLLRANGLRRLDHFAVFMENNIRYAECCAAGERAGSTTPASTRTYLPTSSPRN